MESKYKEKIVLDQRRAQAMALFVEEKVREGAYPAIIFVKELAHANYLSDVLSDALGLEVPAVSAQVPQSRRDEYLSRMRQRDETLPVCVATAVWSTGVDVPPLRWGLVAGAGKAPIGLRQQAGRLTRTCEGKTDYTLYHWVDMGEGMEAYEEQGKIALQHYARSGFNIAGSGQIQSAETGSSSQHPATALLEQVLDKPSTDNHWNPDEVAKELQTPGQQLAHAMCQSPEGFILLVIFYALCGVCGFTLILALLKLLLFGPA